MTICCIERRPSVRLACALGLFLTLTGCGDAEGAGSGSGIEVASRHADGTKLSADDRAAAEFLRSRLAEHWLQGPNGWTTELLPRNVFGQPMSGTSDVPFKQYRKLSFTVEPEELTETMRLNGSDYRGVAAFETCPMRFYRNVETWEGPQGWSAWKDGDLLFRRLALERRAGQWIVEEDELFSGVRPGAGQVPEG